MRSFLLRTSMLLVAVTWLPSVFFAPAHRSGGVVEHAFRALPFPVEAAQFHQLRSPAPQTWCSKLVGFHPGAPLSDLLPGWFGPAEAWSLAPAPGEFLKTWQFRQRTALFPREPCGV